MSDSAIPERVRAAWDAAVAAWDEPKRHEALLAVALETDSFAWVARQYRERKGEPIADAQLERLRKAGLAAMFATATRRPEKQKSPFRMLQLLLLVVVVMVAAGILIMRSLPARGKKSPALPVPTSQVR